MSGRPGRGTLIAGSLAACVLAGASAPALGDSFTPIRMRVSVAARARLHHRLAVTVAVSADPGVLDVRTAPIRVRVKLAAECGGEFTHTAGTVLLDRRLNPQPAPGRPYRASASGGGRPTAYGKQTVCVFLQDDHGLQFATSAVKQVNIARPGVPR